MASPAFFASALTHTTGEIIMKGFAKFILTATAAAAGGTVTARPSAVATVSYSLAVSSEPRTGTRVSWLRPGERVAIECQLQGNWVDGRWGRTNL
ncbi:MAG: hypothetical protein E7L00_04635 [Propionibacteriaceae bacterium]|nr:hypothetical protein [Propionibacteriaceae bacterium]